MEYILNAAMARRKRERERGGRGKANEQRRSKQVNERKRIKRERGKTISSANVYALMREGAQNAEKGNNLIIFFGEYTHQMRI